MANSADPDQKPTDLDLHYLQRQGISVFSMTRVNPLVKLCNIWPWVQQKILRSYAISKDQDTPVHLHSFVRAIEFTQQLNFVPCIIALNNVIQLNIFLMSPQKHIFWVLI